MMSRTQIYQSPSLRPLMYQFCDRILIFLSQFCLLLLMVGSFPVAFFSSSKNIFICFYSSSISCFILSTCSQSFFFIYYLINLSLLIVALKCNKIFYNSGIYSIIEKKHMRQESQFMSLDSMKGMIDKLQYVVPREQEEAFGVLNKQIGELNNIVEIKVNELYKNIINNFNRTALNVLAGDSEIWKANHNHNSLKNLGDPEENTKSRKEKQNIFQIVSKKMILKSDTKPLEKHKKPLNNNILPLIQKPNNDENPQLITRTKYESTFSAFYRDSLSHIDTNFKSTNLLIDNKKVLDMTLSQNKKDSMSSGFQILNCRFQDSPEYIIKICRLNQSQKKQLKKVINHLEEFCERYKIKQAIISSIKFQALLSIKQLPKQRDLYTLFQNKSQIQMMWNKKKVQYWGDEGKIRGAVKVQSTVRMFLERKKFKKLKVESSAIQKIQLYWKGKLRLQETRRMIKQKNLKLLSMFNQSQQNFRKNWDCIKFQNRVQVHIANYGSNEIKRLRTQKFRQRQNTSITRIFRATDPNVTVIYVSSVAISSQISSYYKKILELVQTEAHSQRIYYVTPEIQLSSHQTLIDSILSSPECVNRIKGIINNKLAYIVPGDYSTGMIKLSTQLNIPVFGCVLESRNIQLKSSIPQLIKTERHLPLTHDIYSFQDLYDSLSNLIYSYPFVEKWYFKIDSQKRGRGNSFILMKSFKEFRKLQEMKLQGYKDSIINYISLILKDKLKVRLKMVYCDIYKSYEQYMRVFLSEGGIIQAAANQSQYRSNSTVCVQIQPNNNWRMIGNYQKITIDEKLIGYQFGDGDVSQKVVKQIIDQVIQKFKYFGFISLDFVKVGQVYHLIGVDSFLNEAASSYFMACSLTKTKNPYFFYCPIIMQEQIKQLNFKTFFQFCRLEGISFDVNNGSGCIFVIMDSLQSGCMGSITISQNPKQIYKSLSTTFQFLNKKAERHGQKDHYRICYDGVRFEQIMHKVRIISKRRGSKNICSYNNILPIV